MLRVSLLGEQVIIDDASGVVRMRSSHTVALVAFLVIHAGSPQGRGRIAGLFWPDSTDAQALTNLRRELHQLRQTLGDESSLVVTSKNLTWHDTATCRVDVRTFDVERAAAMAAAAAGDDDGVLRHGAAALAQYGGEFLPGGYADWLLEARADLARRCVELCDVLAATRARTGDLPGAIEVSRRRIALQPMEEVGYRALMDLQADLGDRAGAVSTYHHCASVLERELGVDPDQATRATLQRLLTRSGPEPPAEPRPEPARSGLATAALIGRAREFSVLDAVWREAVSGKPGLALVRGDAGVGKTRLVTDIADQARAKGAVVAITQCFGASSRLALAPVADWLRHPAVRSAAAKLDPVWRVEVDRLVPAGGDPGTPVDESRAMADTWKRHRFFEGLARALVGVGRPTLLVLDNLQWCDEETLAFLSFCLSLTADAQLLITGTLREGNADPEVEGWTARMRGTGRLTEIALGPLEPADTARLAEAISGRTVGAEDTDLLHATTGGFPLHVVEAARAVLDHGEPRLTGGLDVVLSHRLEQASPPARDVAALAAAVGRDFTLDVLSEASDHDADTVVRAVDELWRLRILREFRDGYDFSHDLLRDTAYAQISPAQRWLLHRRLAQVLELSHSGNTDAVSAELAEQYARGGRTERAVGFYGRAAAVATQRCAHAEAIRLHRRALEIVRAWPAGSARDHHELTILEAMASPLTARYGYAAPEVQHALERAITLAESLGRKESVLTGLTSLWSSRFVQGDIADSHRTAARGLAMVEPGSERSEPLHFAIGGSAVSLGRPAEALRHFDLSAGRTSGQLLSVGTRPDVHGMAWSAHAHWLLGHDDEALSRCRDAIALARRIDHPFSLAVALGYGSVTHQFRRDESELAETVAELRELCGRHEFAYYREWGLILDGWGRGGDSGLDLARRGIDDLKSGGAFSRMPYWLSLLADLQAQQGDLSAARATLDAAMATGQTRQDSWWLPEVLRMRAAHDEPGTAVARLRSAAAMATEHGSVALLQRCERDLLERTER